MCEALTRNCCKCRAYPLSNGLCKAHQSFYDGPRPYAFLLRHYSYLSTERQQAYLSKLVRNRRIRTDDPDCVWMLDCLFKGIHIEELPEVEPYLRERALYLYKFLVKSEVLTPDVIPSIWAELLTRNVNLLPYYVEPMHLRSPRTANPKLMEFLYTHLVPYFTSGNTEAQLASIFTIFKRGLEQFEELTKALHRISGTREGWIQIWKRILEELVKNCPKSSGMIRNPAMFLEQMNGYHAAWPNSLWHPVRLHVEGLLACEAATEKQRMQKTNQQLKEELHATALHPDRIAKYIRAGIRPSEL